MEFIKTPEFWLALAFVLVLLIAGRPLKRGLEKWGSEKAKAIQKQFDEAQQLKEHAEKLKEQYQKAYTQRSSARQKLMHEAEVESRFLETELLGQSSDRLKRKKQEVEMRLKMIAEHGRQNVKRQMLNRVIQKTEKLLMRQQGGQSDDLVDQVCQALDSFENVLK